MKNTEKRLKKPNGYWSLERCQESAKKYLTRIEWVKNHKASYEAARQGGWLEHCTRHMEQQRKPNGYWTLERCQEDALQYTTKNDWATGNPTAVAYAYKQGFIAQCCKHMKVLWKHKWLTIEDCKKVAKQFLTRTEWQKAGDGSYQAAWKNGWLSECTAHMKVGLYMGERTIMELLTSLEISFEHQKRFKDDPIVGKFSYDFYIHEYNMLIEYQGLQHRDGERPFHRGVNQQAQQERDKIKRKWALDQGFHFVEIKAWEQKTPADVNAYLKQALLEVHPQRALIGRKLTSAERTQIAYKSRWNIESVIANAKLYANRKEWRESAPGAYSAAERLGVFEKATEHMSIMRRANGYWTKERCLAVARQYSSRAQWEKASSNSYIASLRNGWRDECTAHMERPASHRLKWTLEKCVADAKRYQTKKDWYTANEGAYRAAHQRGWISQCCAHMVAYAKKFKQLKK